MLLKQLNIKILFALVGTICVFNANINNCSAAGTQTGYAAIWRTADVATRKTAALACFNGISPLPVTVSNVTKHALKHLKVTSELPEAVLERTLVSWLSYEGWDNRIAILRQLIAGLYESGNNITTIRRWVTGNTNITADLRNNFRRVWTYTRSLIDNIQTIAGPEEETQESRAILHTYAIGQEQAANHYETDIAEINAFTQFFPAGHLSPEGNRIIDNDEINAFITEEGAIIPFDASAAVRSTAEALAARSRLKRLLHLQRTLFERMNLMTRRMLQECFEPCVKVALANAFSLPGITAAQVQPIQEGTAPQADDGRQPDDIPDTDYSETPPAPAVQALPLAGFGGNPLEDTPPLAASAAGTPLAVTKIKSTFATGASFTQFVRALFLATRAGGVLAHEFDIAAGVNRIDDVVQRADSTEANQTTLLSVIKAARENIAAEGDETTYIAPAHIGGHRRIIVTDSIPHPFVATIYAH